MINYLTRIWPITLGIATSLLAIATPARSATVILDRIGNGNPTATEISK